MKKKVKIIYELREHVDRDNYRELLNIMTGVKTQVYNHGFITIHKYNIIQIFIAKFRCWYSKVIYKNTFKDIYLIN